MVVISLLGKMLTKKFSDNVSESPTTF